MYGLCDIFMCWTCVWQGLDYPKYPAFILTLQKSIVQGLGLLQKVPVQLVHNFDCSEFPLMEIA